MKQRWSLNIKGFGKIQSAKVEVAPMVLFVGENNTGKSYLVSLLWGVLALGRGLFPKDPPSSEAYKTCASRLHPGVDAMVDADFQQALIDWFNMLLKQRKAELVREIFSFSTLSIDHLSISDYQRQKPLQIKWEPKSTEVASRFSAGKDYVRFPYVTEGTLSEAEKYRMVQYLCWKLLMDDLSAPLFPMGAMAGRRVEGETLYLPAARSGFMLTYPSLTAELMEAWGGRKISSTFTLPVVRFLQGLTENRRSKNAKLADIADDLEQTILCGRVVSQEGPINQYLYQAEGSQAGLPYHVASSLVGELSPIIIFLRSSIRYRSMIIEEPEAHLHPAMQKRLACALSRIVSRGVPVWCTTHSETVFQQINNLIKLAAHPDRQALMQHYGYTKDDLLQPGEVKAYEFVTNGLGKTEVKPLMQTEDGFAVPTFNRALIELNQETLAFMQDENGI
jgi:hypothetical protein